MQNFGKSAERSLTETNRQGDVMTLREVTSQGETGWYLYSLPMQITDPQL